MSELWPVGLLFFFCYSIYHSVKWTCLTFSTGMVRKTLSRLIILFILDQVIVKWLKTYVVGTHQKHLGKALLMRTHNICFHGEIEKNVSSFRVKTMPYLEQ